MNRPEKRRKMKEYKKIMSVEQAKALINKRYREDAVYEGVQQGIKGSMDMILYFTAYTINYKLGFGKKRLCRLMDQILFNLDSYRTGQLTHEDYMEIQKICNNLGFKTK